MGESCKSEPTLICGPEKIMSCEMELLRSAEPGHNAVSLHIEAFTLDYRLL